MSNPESTTDKAEQSVGADAQLEAEASPGSLSRSTEVEVKALVAWQRRLMPFMMYGLAVVATVFFVGTFWNYRSLIATMAHKEQPISESIEQARRLNNDNLFADWYVRSVLEERALSGRQRQYSALIQSRLWTRMMGFLAGMVTLLAGAVFILGKLEAEFDGRATVAQGNWSMKTNSPGLVLVAAGVFLMVISLTVTVEVKSDDELIYLPAFVQAVAQPSGPVAADSGAAEVEEKSAEEQAKRNDFACRHAVPTPAGCPPKG